MESSMESKDFNNAIIVGSEHQVSVPHVRQCYNWDCGLACVSMVLKALGESPTDVYTKDLDAMECGESIWTIDLAYILSRHNIALRFYTITLGVDPEHSKKPFYQSSFTYDESRVNLMFQNAALRGIHVQKRSLHIEELLQQVRQERPVIVLVNKSYLHCLSCESGKTCWDCLTLCQKPFVGHFVVLCGFDRKKDLVLFKDPESSCHDTCIAPMSDFDRARCSDGTDEDVIVVLRPQPSTAPDCMGDGT